MAFPGKAKRMRAITARELARNVASTFDSVESGERVLLLRNGRPIGTIEPLEEFVVERFIRERAEQEGNGHETEREEYEWDSYLTDDHRKVIAGSPTV